MNNTVQKEERTGLTVEKVFEKQKYINILAFISGNQKKNSGIRRSQLIKALILENEEKPKTYLSKRNKIFLFPISSNDKFNSVLGLRNALIRLRDLGLIKSVKPKNNYRYWVLTDYGFILYYKWTINFKINHLIYDIDSLMKINKSLVVYINKEAKKMKKKKN